MRVLDPAEASLPFNGRVRFAGPDRVRIEKAAPVLPDRVALVKDFLARVA